MFVDGIVVHMLGNVVCAYLVHSRQELVRFTSSFVLLYPSPSTRSWHQCAEHKWSNCCRGRKLKAWDLIRRPLIALSPWSAKVAPISFTKSPSAAGRVSSASVKLRSVLKSRRKSMMLLHRAKKVNWDLRTDGQQSRSDWKVWMEGTFRAGCVRMRYWDAVMAAFCAAQFFLVPVRVLLQNLEGTEGSILTHSMIIKIRITTLCLDTMFVLDVLCVQLLTTYVTDQDLKNGVESKDSGSLLMVPALQRSPSKRMLHKAQTSARSPHAEVITLLTRKLPGCLLTVSCYWLALLVAHASELVSNLTYLPRLSRAYRLYVYFSQRQAELDTDIRLVRGLKRSHKTSYLKPLLFLKRSMTVLAAGFGHAELQHCINQLVVTALLLAL